MALDPHIAQYISTKFYNICRILLIYHDSQTGGQRALDRSRSNVEQPKIGIGLDHLGLITAQTIFPSPSPTPTTVLTSSGTRQRTAERGKGQLPSGKYAGQSSNVKPYIHGSQSVMWDFSKGYAHGVAQQQSPQQAFFQVTNHSTQPATVLPQSHLAQLQSHPNTATPSNNQQLQFSAYSANPSVKYGSLNPQNSYEQFQQALRSSEAQRPVYYTHQRDPTLNTKQISKSSSAKEQNSAWNEFFTGTPGTPQSETEVNSRTPEFMEEEQVVESPAYSGQHSSDEMLIPNPSALIFSPAQRYVFPTSATLLPSSSSIGHLGQKNQSDFQASNHSGFYSPNPHQTSHTHSVRTPSAHPSLIQQGSAYSSSSAHPAADVSMRRLSLRTNKPSGNQAHQNIRFSSSSHSSEKEYRRSKSHKY